LKILIAEDNEDNRKLLVKQLRFLNHEVTGAANGKEALSIGLADPPDILVTDILMPDMDGYQLCVEWKQNEKLQSIPLIFFTATYTSDEDEKFALSLGGDAFIRKPVELNNLSLILTELYEKGKSGNLPHPEFTSAGSSKFLIEHNKRLLSKLYHKVAQLEMDINERKKAEESVRESEEKFRQFFENAQVYCYILSPAGIIIEINQTACQSLGYRKEELIGRPLSRISPPEYLSRFQELVKEWNLTGLIKGEEMVVLTRTGVKRDVILSISAIRSQAGAITSMISVQRDITEVKQSRTKAQEVETLTSLSQAKSEMLSNVAHELRTPLASIKGFIETLIEPDVKWSKKDQLEFLTEANKEVDILNQLIRDLLDVSRLESGKLRLDKHYYGLPDVLESIKARLVILTAKHLLEIKIAPELPRIYVDKLRLAQVLTNLVENATKFSPHGSPITLEAAVQGNDLVISVTDRGVGMTQETIDHLFSRFFRGEQAVTAQTKGTGLGLSICRGIVEAHNGKIRVESKVGQGTTFSFNIPLTPPEHSN
jgi:two-component system, cell cycle sensor histidine kinase and response regulator CckA